MKSILLAMYFLFLANICFAQKLPNCAENPDRLYDRQKILEQLAETFNKVIPEFHKTHPAFRVEEERAILFFVHDLTDPTNKQMLSKECVNFINNHVYHVAPMSYEVAFSYIVILEEGKLKIFASVNCLNRDDKIEDVLKYLEAKLANDKNKDEILERVKNYRKYGIYYKICGLEILRCTPVNTNEN